MKGEAEETRLVSAFRDLALTLQGEIRRSIEIQAMSQQSSRKHGTATDSDGDSMSYQIKWVKLEKYVELTGDSVDSVMSRRKAGKWLDGDQCEVVDGRIRVNLEAAQEWVESWGEPRPAQLTPSQGSSRRPRRA